MAKKISRRDFLRMSALTAAGAALAGCAQPTPEVQIVEQTVEVPVEVEVEKTVEVPVEQTVVVQPTAPPELEGTLRVSAESWIIQKWPVEKVAQLFMDDHPGVTVEVSPAPSKGEGETYLIQWSQGRTNVDVALGGSKSDVATYVGQDLLVEFGDDFFTGDFARDEFIEAFLQEGEFAGGKQYAVPLLGEVMYTTVRRDWYEEAGLLDADGKPIPPKDWDGWKEYADALTIPGERSGLAISWGTNFMWQQYLTGLQVSKGSIYESEGSTMVDFSSEYAEALLQFWQDIVNAGYAPTGTFTDQNANRNDFKAGLIGSMITAHSRWPECEQVLEAGGEDLVTAMPILEGAGTLAYAHTIYVPKESPVPDLAKAFVKEQILSLYGQQWSANNYGKLPTLKRNFAVLDAPEYQDILAAAAVGVHEPNYKEQRELNAVLQVELEKCITGAQTPADTLANLQDAAKGFDLSLV